MNHPNNPKSGVAITGLALGTVVEVSADKKYTNYRLGVLTESRPDKYNVVQQITNEIELTQIQYDACAMLINQNQKKPIRVWIDIDHRAGESNGRVWDFLRLRMRSDSQVEFLEGVGNHLMPSSNASDFPAGVTSSKKLS
jgi:hypothetical protein